MTEHVLETGRLHLDRFDLTDAEFILRLVNDPSFIENIGDKGVRTRADAEAYLRDGPLASYSQHGFGLWRISLKQGGAVIGMCGLIKRPTLEDVDLGYAFLPEARGQGYALEAAQGVMTWAREQGGLRRVVAIVVPENRRSIRVLENAGFRYEHELRLDGGADLQLYAWDGGLAG